MSIVISSHNDGHVLQKAIDSALDQTYPDIEVVVVDGGSIDDSREVIASYGDQIIPVLKENGGQASAFNAGFQLSRGEAILFLDPRDTLPLTAVGSGVDVASWRHQLGVAVREVLRLVPAGEAFVLVDSDSWGTDEDLGGRRRIPFLERDGQYGGAPPDDETAIRDLERLRRSGASFMVFAWPAFWWLEHYSGLRDHLRSKFRCVIENERLVAFDLRP